LNFFNPLAGTSQSHFWLPVGLVPHALDGLLPATRSFAAFLLDQGPD